VGTKLHQTHQLKTMPATAAEPRSKPGHRFIFAIAAAAPAQALAQHGVLSPAITDPAQARPASAPTTANGGYAIDGWLVVTISVALLATLIAFVLQRRAAPRA
jgi:hypothetical protein